MHAANTSAPDTAVAVVRDYAMRTFSRADAVEPREPFHIRVACCDRLAGPALDFAELPDARMHWTPLPRRGTEGIEAWLPQWMCMRCQNELRLERICVPDPTPSCPVCLTPMLWEVDCPRRQERWVCSRCPFAHSGRPLALRPVPPCRSPDLPNHAPPALPAADPGMHNALHAPVPAPTQFAILGPPALPLRDGTNSALYVPLLLDAAGMLSAEAQRDWRSRAPINEWWDAAVQALRAEAFIPAHELSAAVEHVAQAFASPVLHSPSVMRFRAWAAAQAGNVTSLAELVCVIAVAPEGHYIAAPRQEALLTLFVRPVAVATFARLIEGLRARPVDVPPRSASAHAAAPAALRWQGDEPVDDAAAPAAVRQPDAPLFPPAAPAPAASPQAQHTAASHGTHPPGADGEPDADFIGSAAARIVDIERRARGRGRRGGRGRGRGRHASPAARDTDAAEADQCQPGPSDSTASQRRVLSAEAAFRAGLRSLDAIDLAATLRRRVLTLQTVPVQVRSTLRTAFRAGLQLNCAAGNSFTSPPACCCTVPPAKLAFLPPSWTDDASFSAEVTGPVCSLLLRRPCDLRSLSPHALPGLLMTLEPPEPPRSSTSGSCRPPHGPLSLSLLRLALPTPSASCATQLIGRRSPTRPPIRRSSTLGRQKRGPAPTNVFPGGPYVYPIHSHGL